MFIFCADKFEVLQIIHCCVFTFRCRFGNCFFLVGETNLIAEALRLKIQISNALLLDEFETGRFSSNHGNDVNK